MKNQPVVAIDGPSGVGKSTVAKGVAKIMNYQFIDTGALYRTVALVASQKNIDWNDASNISKEAVKQTFTFDPDGNLSLNGTPVGETIRNNKIAQGASAVAKHKEVRDALLTIQRNLGKHGAVVLEGRDIGTVVFPGAEIKFYLTASIKERAKRRFLQLKKQNSNVTIDEVETAQIERDKQDTEREIAPLKKADDALEVNCENMSADQVIAFMCDHINKHLKNTRQ